MDRIVSLVVRVRQGQRGQTMGEYGLIVSTVTIAAYDGYKIIGTNINTLIITVDGDL